MASICLSICSTSKPLVVPPTSSAAIASSSSSSPSCNGCRCSFPFSTPMFGPGRLIYSTASINSNRSRRQKQVVCMAPEEEKLTRRNPLDFPIVRFSLHYIFILNYLFWKLFAVEIELY